MSVDVHPITPARAEDLERFSCTHGKFRYCSCMRWRMASAEYARSAREDRVTRLDMLARAGEPIGVLAYRDGVPVGWCSVAPRETYRALERYKALARVDDLPVWSVVCFFVDRTVRGQGVTRELLTGAVDFAVESGARIVEGYPVEPSARLYTYMGSSATFLAAGFADVTPPGRQRRVMRYAAAR